MKNGIASKKIKAKPPKHINTRNCTDKKVIKTATAAVAAVTAS